MPSHLGAIVGLASRATVTLLLLSTAAPAESAPAPRHAPRETWVAKVYDRAAPSVVRVECGEAIGAGFVFHSSRHVATAFHVIESGRDVTVVQGDGSEVDARVVAWSFSEDLAILELATQARGAALTPAPPQEPRVGDRVVALGAPMDSVVRQAHRSELPVVTSTVGTISFVTETAVQTDAAINPGNSGGPLLDEQGHLLGVISRKVSDAEGLAFAVPTPKLVALTGEIGRTPPFWGFVSGDFMASYVLADHDLDGLELGLRLIVFDRVGLGLRFGWLGNRAEFVAGQFIEERDRRSLEAHLFYRFSLYAPPYLVLHIPVGIGIASTRDELQRTRFAAQLEDPSCDLSSDSCPLTTEGLVEKARDDRFRPMFTVELELTPILLSSAFYLANGNISGGRFGIGLVF